MIDRSEGPVFVRMFKGGVIGTSRAGVALVDHIVKKRAQLGGVEGHYSAHSLRSGLAVSAAQGGATSVVIMRQIGHGSNLAVTGYLQEHTGFDDNVMQYLDL